MEILVFMICSQVLSESVLVQLQKFTAMTIVKIQENGGLILVITNG